MKHRLIIASLALLISASSAFALDLDEDALLKDYTGVTNLLRANGIEPSVVRWGEVESMCLPIKSSTNTLTYNRCRFEKARDQIVYREDTGVCNDESRAFNTDSVLYQNFIGGVAVITPTTPTVADKAAFRRYVFDRCMRDKGWRSSRGYQLGQTD